MALGVSKVETWLTRISHPDCAKTCIEAGTKSATVRLRIKATLTERFTPPSMERYRLYCIDGEISHIITNHGPNYYQQFESGRHPLACSLIPGRKFPHPEGILQSTSTPGRSSLFCSCYPKLQEVQVEVVDSIYDLWGCSFHSPRLEIL